MNAWRPAGATSPTSTCVVQVRLAVAALVVSGCGGGAPASSSPELPRPTGAEQRAESRPGATDERAKRQADARAGGHEVQTAPPDEPGESSRSPKWSVTVFDLRPQILVLRCERGNEPG